MPHRLYEAAVRPLLFRLDAERAHELALRASELSGRSTVTRRLAPRACGVRDPRLRTTLAGIPLENPLGLAAGFDKNGRAIGMLGSMGFGHVEIGSVSAHPSDGNPRPRLFRIPQDRGIVVAYGVPNDGAEAVRRRLDGPRGRPRSASTWSRPTTRRGPPSRPTSTRTTPRSFALLQDRADYVALNLSCPNSAADRDFFDELPRIDALLARLGDCEPRVPVFLKLKPTRDAGVLREIVAIADRHPFVAGFAINLPAGKPDDLDLTSPRASLERMPGAVGGPPVEALVNAILATLYGIVGPRQPLRADGGRRRVRPPRTRTASCGSARRSCSSTRARVPRAARGQGDPRATSSGCSSATGWTRRRGGRRRNRDGGIRRGRYPRMDRARRSSTRRCSTTVPASSWREPCRSSARRSTRASRCWSPSAREKIGRLRERARPTTPTRRIRRHGRAGSQPGPDHPGVARVPRGARRPGRRPIRGIGEPIWAGRSADELVECQLHEALLNVAFADADDFRLLCPYDMRRARRRRRARGALQPSGRRRRAAPSQSHEFRGIDDPLAPFAAPLPRPPGAAETVAFERDDAGRAAPPGRRPSARRPGSAWTAREDLVLAVNELATNSVRHAGGHGILRMWRDDGALLCEVRDRGRIDDPLVGRRRAPRGPDRRLGRVDRAPGRRPRAGPLGADGTVVRLQDALLVAVYAAPVSHVVVSNLAYAHPGGDLLFSEVSFKIAPGQHVGLVGANGVGKSTLFRVLAGRAARRRRRRRHRHVRLHAAGRGRRPDSGRTVRELLLEAAPARLRDAGRAHDRRRARAGGRRRPRRRGHAARRGDRRLVRAGRLRARGPVGRRLPADRARRARRGRRARHRRSSRAASASGSCSRCCSPATPPCCCSTSPTTSSTCRPSSTSSGGSPRRRRRSC